MTSGRTTPIAGAAVGTLQEKLWHQGTVYRCSGGSPPGEGACGPARAAELLEELAWARDARAPVRRRLLEFLGLLDDEPDPSVRAALAVLAAQSPEDGEEALARVLPDARAEQNDPRRLVLELAVGALGGDVDRADLLRRLPEDYYDEEGVEELRGRFAEAADEHEVYREILEEVAGVAIDVSGRGEQAGG